MHIDPTGEEWWHWAIAGGIVVLLVAATILSAGTATLGVMALVSASLGVGSGSTGLTLLSFAAIATATTLSGFALYSATSSYNLSDFYDQGESALYATIVSAVIGVGLGYLTDKASLDTYGTYSTPKNGRPGSTYTQVDSHGNTMRIARYNHNGNLAWRIDFSGKPHYIEGYGSCLPHIHEWGYTYQNNKWVTNSYRTSPFFDIRR